MHSDPERWQRFGTWLKRMRNEQAISMSEAARRGGFKNPQGWFRYEKGAAARLDTVRRLAAGLSLPENEARIAAGYAIREDMQPPLPQVTRQDRHVIGLIRYAIQARAAISHLHLERSRALTRRLPQYIAYHADLLGIELDEVHRLVLKEVVTQIAKGQYPGDDTLSDL